MGSDQSRIPWCTATVRDRMNTVQELVFRIREIFLNTYPDPRISSNPDLTDPVLDPDPVRLIFQSLLAKCIFSTDNRFLMV